MVHNSEPGTEETLRDGLQNAKLAEASVLSVIATIAAYNHEPVWLNDLIRYLEGNILRVEQFFRENDLGITAVRPEASFLVWLDCRAKNLSQEKLISWFQDDAGILVNNGASYGTGGEGFVRLNVGCPRSIVDEALGRILKLKG